MASAAGIDMRHERGAAGDKHLFETMGSGAALSDLDGDGRVDLVLLQSGSLAPEQFDADQLPARGHRAGATNRLYLNRGGLRFDERTAGSGLDRAGTFMGLAVGDVDADGDRDLWLAAYGDDLALRNDGAARFEDVSVPSGLADRRWNIGGAFLDADLDGDLDLYVVGYLDVPLSGNPICGPAPDQRTYCHVDSWAGLDDRLLLNDGGGRFVDGSAAASLPGTGGKGLAVVGGDFDDDGDTDLFVANDSSPNMLLRNEGDGRFVQVGRMSSVDLNGDGRTEACMGADFGDLDGDLDLDLYVVNFEQETNTLYRNDGRGFFTDVSTSSGAGVPSTRVLGFGTLFADLDVDGDLDIYVANGHIDDNIGEISPGSRYAQVDHLYLNDGRGRFALAPAELSPSLSQPRVGRGVVTGDLDGDGDDDLVVTNNGQRPWVLRNDLATGNRITLRLAGPDGRADAEGARVLVTLGERTFMREVRVGGSYLCSRDTEVVLGLGAADVAEQVQIRWPGGAVSTHGPLQAGRRYSITFGGEQVSEQALAPPSR
ncbi:MAG: hypothetical protein DRQ55_04385 [Planctomycetota bacterium]|nr:MAG: hypothetical protein DRQ55_04385 [Planctomycetota bacterium]